MAIQITWNGTDRKGRQVTVRISGDTAKQIKEQYTDALPHLKELGGIDLAPSEQSEKMDRLMQLTRRENDIYELLCEGLSYKDMARKLTLSIHTIGSHVKHIRSKLGLNRASQASLIHVTKHLELGRQGKS